MSPANASTNTAVGYESLNKNTTGSENNILDLNLYKKTQQVVNIGIGNSALYENTTGDENVAVGYNALSANTTASGNTGVGHLALSSNTTGGSNTQLAISH